MDISTKTKYHYALDDDWIQLGFQNLAGRDFTNLHGAKHGIFEYHAWSRPHGQETVNGQRRARTFPPANYNALCGVVGHSFEIASRILECPASLDFIYHIVYGNREKLEPQWNHNRQPCWELYPSDDGKKTDAKLDRRAKAREVLQWLQESLRFQICHEDEFPPLEGYDALTGYTNGEAAFYSGISLKDRNADQKTGLASIIRVNNAAILRIANLRQSMDPDERGPMGSYGSRLFRRV